MWIFKVVLVGVVGGFLVVGGSVVWGVMPAASKGMGGSRVEAPSKEQGLKKAPGAVKFGKAGNPFREEHGGRSLNYGGWSI